MLDSTSHRGAPLRVTVTGGGPVGALFALCLRAHLGARVELTVFDKRWRATPEGVRWRSAEEGNRRREHVVTLQSALFEQLPPAVQGHLFEGGYSEVWPTGWYSPAAPPRNVPLRALEERLLAALSRSGVTLRAEEFSVAGADLGACDALVIAEGARSPTREALADRFGAPAPVLAAPGARAPLEDTILGLEVQTALDPSLGVVLTVAQSRFLLNTHEGRGVLNMRLSPSEAREAWAWEARGWAGWLDEGALDEGAPPPPLTSSPLWRRLREGLRLFGVRGGDLRAIRAFRQSMLRRPRLTAQVAPGVVGCLIGDAATALHVWPGRGLNLGLVGAASLARALAAQGGGRVSLEDLAGHEREQGAQRDRHIERARLMMLAERPTPCPLTRAQLIEWGGAAAGGDPARGEAARVGLVARARATRDDLRGRLPRAPTDEELAAALGGLSDEEAGAMLASGRWRTGGAACALRGSCAPRL